ncbi:MAG: acetoacetate--CoA ligase [Acidobacteriota bacterium]
MMTTEPRPERILEGTRLWEPSEKRKSQANLTRYLHWLQERKGLAFDSYHDLWQWSVTDLEGFWSSIWNYFEVQSHHPYGQVLDPHQMPGAGWFTGARLNYAEHALRRRDEHPAVLSTGEDRPLDTLTYRELYRQTASVAAGLRDLGVRKGDRVVAVLPNIPEALVAFLATASLGAVWSSCSPEFGTRSIVERFGQIEPRILIAVDGYRYKGREHRCMKAVSEIQDAIPSLETTIVVPHLETSPRLESGSRVQLWTELLSREESLVFEAVPFSHPLWLVYSSGTTGPPKPIVHSQGGILLEHLKELSLHLDLSERDRFFWFTTTGWMMWNFLAGGLLVGSTLVLYEGSPAYPDMNCLWQLSERAQITYFGTSASYIQSCIKSEVHPAAHFNLDALTSLGSTGSPLSPEGFGWVYAKVKEDLLLGSLSGGTDLCTGFLGPSPLLPVHAGEIQCRQLGVQARSYDSEGKAVVDQVGELVIEEPMPSMPICFWNDQGDRRYQESYFEDFPGVWRHGDWIKFTPHGSCVIYGRSDSTLNRGGVRMGTSEFYRVVEELPEVMDSLVVETGPVGEEGRLLLFVVLPEKVSLDPPLANRIQETIRLELSPRHLPDKMYSIAEVPRTLSGKKLEVPVKRILSGIPVEEALSKEAAANPKSLQFFSELARQGPDSDG